MRSLRAVVPAQPPIHISPLALASRHVRTHTSPKLLVLLRRPPKCKVNSVALLGHFYPDSSPGLKGRPYSIESLQESSETMSSDAAKLMPERSTLSASVKNAAESAIATVAYQLWLNNGCPVGSDQEDWFRAEAMLKNALVAKREDLSRRPSIPRCDTRTESEMTAEFLLEGHWEVWESEWGGARWIPDLDHSEARTARPSP